MRIDEESVGALAVNEVAIMRRIAEELGIAVGQVSAVLTLTAEGCTVPFISRYRKERTGDLDEVKVRDVTHMFASYGNLETRRIEVAKAIFGQGKLTEELYDTIARCATLAEIEDLYAPYKRKKKTRGMLAEERGLAPLAELMRDGDEAAVLAAAPSFVRTDAEKPELSVATAEEAIAGAKDILAERCAQDPDNRALVKARYLRDGFIVCKGVGGEEKAAASNYAMYWDFREPLSALKPHRILAINRGEREGELEVSLEGAPEAALADLRDRVFPRTRFHDEAIADGLARLLSPAVLREIRSDAFDRADAHGIDVFSGNLRNLLMSPPIKGSRVLALDPGIRTGTKCAVLDETGKFLAHFVFYQERDPEGAKTMIAEAARKFSAGVVAVGNGTASHEVQRLVADAIAERGLSCEYVVVDEDGASVYSASDVAREEFPELDLTVRGAISIGRRLQDPLAELVKIDPKSIGVGLYQHDLNQKRLSESLDEVVGSVVNNVGVNLNTASHSLLKYVSGINSSLAKKIVRYRDEHGKILTREGLKNVPGLGEKTFEQCAGFLKIAESPEPLDNTWVHPERYALAKELLPFVRSGAQPDAETRKALKERFDVGDMTVDDILKELAKPNRDPREDLPKPLTRKDALSFEDLKEGMTVTGKVKNVVDFGAFVDIGIKESALIHVSEMADRFVRDPMEVLKVGDVKEFRIISLDTARMRIGLSLKSARSDSARGGESAARGEPRSSGNPSGGRRVVVAGKKGEPATQARGANPYSVKRRDDRPTETKTDDGMSYNPFAELLKDRKK